jgi:hypothetical protein
MKREMIHMSNLRFQKLSGSARSAMVPFAIAAMWAAGACPGLAQQSAQQSAQPSAQVSAQQTFTSAADAGKSLFQAVQSNNSETIVNILGGPTELASSGDEPQDKLDRECFVQKYQQMHRMVREANGTVMLYIGAENWPFPIPLVEKNGSWRFDSDAGMKEVLYRRIGENELTAIATCRDFAAQTQAGVKPKATGAQDFPASLVARAASDAGAATPILFHGYYFQVLPLRSTKTTGGFALIAYPAEYRSSGVMTFVVAAKDVVYEKDFGANTSALASAIKAFHKDATWHAANE